MGVSAANIPCQLTPGPDLKCIMLKVVLLTQIFTLIIRTNINFCDVLEQTSFL